MTIHEMVKMELHAFLDLTETITILRVPGGWLYVDSFDTTFVPIPAIMGEII